MNKYHLECTYCGHNWEENRLFGTPLCSRCGDKKIRIKEAERSKIDYYEGCEPFPKQSETKGQSKEDRSSKDSYFYGDDDDPHFNWSGGD